MAVAEGEELQTNLLQASQRIPASSGVLDEVFGTQVRLNVAMRLTHMAAISKNEGSQSREANTHPLCRRIFLFNRFDRRFVHRSSPIGNRLRLFSWQDLSLIHI